MRKYFHDKRNLYKIGAGIIILVIGFFIGRETTQPQIIKNKVLRESGYTYINPILLCNVDVPRTYNEDISLSKELENYVSQSKNNISAYYLGLLGGGWAGVNMDEAYSPASMLKIPTVVDALKYSETHPEILNQKFYYDGSFDNNRAEFYKPEKTIQIGQPYSLDELLTYIIAYSDNNALTVLHENIDAGALSELYKDLNINIPTNSLDFMTVKTYALFLRVLYNSTYLSREMSEKVLHLMAYRDFPIGIQAGVPKTIDIADKFGERQVFDTSGNLIKRELHDCGIIYATDKPYILCVMTSGSDFDSLAQNLRDVSKIVYDNVSPAK